MYILRLTSTRRRAICATLSTIRNASTSILPKTKIRNIGILAHIDAGKTTTTERMLFYSGKTNVLGEVHHGNTVTDFLKQERERGITICSAAVAFPWKEHRINLLDTPGHIDFTMEVEQSLAAVDGTVVILDGSAGVEAQTVTVWNQINCHSLPRMVFVNKMDRPDANFEASVNDVEKKLDVIAVPLQRPIFGKKGINGIIDVINLKHLQFDASKDGRVYKKIPLAGDQLAEVTEKRCELIDMVSGYDDELAEAIISQNSLEEIDSDLLVAAIRRATISQKIVPILLGSSYKNIGVQPLIDAVIHYLPAPDERNHYLDCFGKDFAGKVFKVMHDKQRGPLSLVRVLRGKLLKGAKLTTATGQSEVLQKIYEPLADEYREITQVDEGNVAVCAGLKTTATGNLLVLNMSSLKSAEQTLAKMLKVDANDRFVTSVFRLETKIPDAVYFCSIEPSSLAYQQAMETALAQLQREDPSLRVHYDETTMQTVLGGMGELHLEIIKSRLETEYKLEVDLGPLQIAYKETLENEVRETVTVKKEIAGAMQEVMIEMSLVKGDENSEIFKMDTSPECAGQLAIVRPRHIPYIKKGALSALSRGPRVGGPVVDTCIVLHNIVIGRGTAESFLMSAASQCVQKLLLNGGCRLLEPMMALEIVVPEDRSSPVMSDLGRRRAEIQDISFRGENKVISVNAPLAELSGYSSTLRTMTSGTSSMSMQPNGHILMDSQTAERAIRIAQGLE